jgi:hypothetical protein
MPLLEITLPSIAKKQIIVIKNALPIALKMFARNRGVFKWTSFGPIRYRPGSVKNLSFENSRSAIPYQITGTPVIRME